MIYCSQVERFDGNNVREECDMSFDVNVDDIVITFKNGKVEVLLNRDNDEKPTISVVCHQVDFGDNPPFWW